MDARHIWSRVWRAPERAMCGQALGLDELRTVGGQEIRDLDVRVVDRGAQARQERGGEHKAHGCGLAGFGLQVRIAADLPVVLVRGRFSCRKGIERNPAVGECALRGRECCSRGAEIRTAIQSDVDGLTELGSVGSAYRLVVATAEADVLDRRPGQ